MMKYLFSIFLFFVLLISGFAGDIRIDTSFPGGNITVESIQNNVVRVHQQMRDSSGDWFYWAFRVFGAEGQTIHFEFTKRPPLSTRGPAFSRDGGQTWHWLGKPGQKRDQFDFTFAKDDREVRFSVGIPYTQVNLERFLAQHVGSPFLKKDILTLSTKKRPIELIRIADFQTKKKVGILLTGSHHCCEQIALNVAEGIAEAALADTETGRTLRNIAEIRFIPFMDKDGVEEGDQGKNRKPHDLNRDYIQELYPAVKAVKKLFSEWQEPDFLIHFDFHCPELYDDPPNLHQTIFFTPPFQEKMQKNLAKLVFYIDKYQKNGRLHFGRKNGIAGKTFINDLKTQKTGAMWTGEQTKTILAATIEIPYANIEGQEATPEALREFGNAFAKAILEYLEKESK